MKKDDMETDDAGRRAAEDALLDRTLFKVSPKAYTAFVARLDAPPAPNKRLRRTMNTPAPWEFHAAAQ
jgi:uncharacterized protein (DUF1778 family)